MHGMYDELLSNLAILVLSGFVGFAVISKVPNTLHTPLMSGTNAIHGIVVLGALVVFGEVEHPSLAVKIILFVAVVFGTLNVIGGFIVTDRMLGMFKGKKKPGRKTRRGRQMNYLVIGLYVISFALFIYGLMGLTGPKTAVRGNLIAAVGMALAVTATLIKIRHTDQWPLIIAGLVVGVVLGVPPARLHQDDRHAAAGGVLQRRRRRHGRAHRTRGIHGDERLFGLPARRVADRAHRGRVAVRRDHRVDLVLGLDHRVRQAAGDHLRLADRSRQGAAAGQPAAAGRARSPPRWSSAWTHIPAPAGSRCGGWSACWPPPVCWA